VFGRLADQPGEGDQCDACEDEHGRRAGTREADPDRERSEPQRDEKEFPDQDR